MIPPSGMFTSAVKKRTFFVAVVLSSWLYSQTGGAQTSPSIALTGSVSSGEEGPMEGVLIGAKRMGSTMTITVVSDDQGRYRFPSSKLTPGRYALRIRAAGYDLDGPSGVEISASKTATADLK